MNPAAPHMQNAFRWLLSAERGDMELQQPVIVQICNDSTLKLFIRWFNLSQHEWKLENVEKWVYYEVCLTFDLCSADQGQSCSSGDVQISRLAVTHLDIFRSSNKKLWGQTFRVFPDTSTHWREPGDHKVIMLWLIVCVGLNEFLWPINMWHT